MTRSDSPEGKGVAGPRPSLCDALEARGTASSPEILARRPRFEAMRADSTSSLKSAMTLGAGTALPGAFSTHKSAEELTWQA